jgi:hypothetical protein
MPMFEFWPRDFGRIMAIKSMERGGSKLGSMGFFNISIKFRKFLIDRVVIIDFGFGSASTTLAYSYLKFVRFSSQYGVPKV